MLRLPRLVLLGFLFSSCGSNKDSQLISYDNLNEIEYRLEMEIGNENEFFFGELWNLIIGSDGAFVVSDWGKKTIEQFHADGTYAGTIATEGRGPGELHSRFMLYRGMGDTLIVRQLGMFQNDYFIKETDTDIYSHDSSFAVNLQHDRAVMMIGQVSDSDYLARTTWDTEVRGIEGRHFDGYNLVPISIVDKAENIQQDSLHMLKGPESITLFSGGAMYPVGIPPYRFHDRMRLIEDGRYYIARADTMVIHIYQRNHTLDYSVEFDVEKRSVENKDIEFNLRDIYEGHRHYLKENIPAYKPAFLDAWVSTTLVLLHTDSREQGKEFVVLSLEGKALGKFYLSIYDEIQYVSEEQIYTLHKDPEKGHTVRKYRLIF